MTAADKLAACNARLLDARAQVERFEGLVNELANKSPVFDAEGHAQCRQKYEDVVASLEVGEASAGEVQAARAALEESDSACREADAERARLAAAAAGMQRKLETARSAVAALEVELKQTLIEWGEIEIEIAERTYLEHAHIVADARARIETIRYWLHHTQKSDTGHPSPWANSLQIPALGPLGAQQALENNPSWDATQSRGYGITVTPKVDYQAANKALELEIDELIAKPESMLAAAKRAMTKVIGAAK